MNSNCLSFTSGSSIFRPIHPPTAFTQMTQTSMHPSVIARPITGNIDLPACWTYGKSLKNQVKFNKMAGGFDCSALMDNNLLIANFSRKVFIGGLPPDISESEIINYFQYFGSLIVDWPHKTETKSMFPPKGYAFLIFEKEESVQELIRACVVDNNKFYVSISSSSVQAKHVQVKPWYLNDSTYIVDETQAINPRRTVFVGGVPRPLKSSELALIMNQLYGGVCSASIDTDSELKYPKGAGRVSFSNQESFVKAIASRFVRLQCGEIDKRAEVKPYVLDEQVCDICRDSQRSQTQLAPFFCANTACLQYFCESCWMNCHSAGDKNFHKPLVKEGTDRPRTIPFRWC